MSDGKKKFGDQVSPTFCVLPWIHYFVLPTGNVHQCCVAPYDQPNFNLSEVPLSQILNSKSFQDVRKKMLAGEKVSACEACYINESVGHHSLRESFNERFSDRIVESVKDTLPSGEIKEPKLRYVDIRFSNLCNFKCRSCGSLSSSSWQADEIALGAPKEATTSLLFASARYPEFWNDLEKQLDTLDEIYFAGGEPLLMEDHYKVLEILIAKGRTDIRLRYNSNFSFLQIKNRNAIEFWKKFSNVSINFSLDGLEKRCEYVRKGMDWKRLERNIDLLMKEVPHVSRAITYTVSIFNVAEVVAFREEVLRKKWVDPEYGLHLNFVLDPLVQRVQILPPSAKAEVSTQLLQYARSIQRQSGKTFFVSQLQALVDFMHAEDHSLLIPVFLKKSAALDRVRKESLFEACPELTDYLTRTS